MAKLDDSYEDIVVLIVDMLKDSTPRHLFMKDLRSLSLTCRHLRQICLSLLFGTLRQTWGFGMWKQMLPQNLCSYVLVFELNMHAVDLYLFADVGPPAELSNGLAKILPHMSSLHTFRFTNSFFYGAWPALLRAVLSAPNIHSLEICDSTWRSPSEAFAYGDFIPLQNSDETPTRSFHSPLRRFAYRAPFTDCFPPDSPSYGRRDTVQGTVELANLLVLIELLRASLEALEIPAELGCQLISGLTTNELGIGSGPLFPYLREFRVQGHAPFGEARWIDLIVPAAFPELRVLEFHLAQPKIPMASVVREFGDYYRICPLTSAHDLNNSHAESNLSRLHTLALSTPHPTDFVFQILPIDNLVELDLRAYPLPGILHSSSLYPLSETPTIAHLQSVLDAMSLSNLETLRVSYKSYAGSEGSRENAEESFLSRLPTLFQNLLCLEIHRYRPLAQTNEEDDPLPRLKHYLPRLRRLSNLLVDIDHPEQRLGRGGVNALWRQANTGNLQQDAMILAKEIQSLKSIGMLSHEDFSSHWKKWDVVRTQFCTRPGGEDPTSNVTLFRASDDNLEPNLYGISITEKTECHLIASLLPSVPRKNPTTAIWSSSAGTMDTFIGYYCSHLQKLDAKRRPDVVYLNLIKFKNQYTPNETFLIGKWTTV
uniref:F-box domain-containing protein n=1 Tax=Moniliophthora roreri TaxID=221103 RepID=A0A0W0G496_MONRR